MLGTSLLFDTDILLILFGYLFIPFYIDEVVLLFCFKVDYMLSGLHQNRVMTLYNNKGKVLFFRNSYHYKKELRLKLLNFSKFSKMR